MFFDRENFKKIAEILRAGKICVLPTDTIFGFSAAIFAAKNLSRLKNRRPKKPFLMLFPDFLAAEKAVDFSELARHFFANIDEPTTFVLPRKKGAFPDFFPDENFLAIRVPKKKILVKFLHFFGAPILSTSVNFADEKPLFEFFEIQKRFPEIPIFAPRENFFSQKSSPIVKIVGEKVQILRGEKIFCDKIKKNQDDFLRAQKIHNSLLEKGKFWKN